MEQKLSDTLVKAIDRSNPMMQNLQLASRFNALVESGGGDVVLEDNKAVTINASTYSAPVEVTPTEGKDAMKKVTVSLSNIPAGSGTLYCWIESSSPLYLDTGENPNIDNINSVKTIGMQDSGLMVVASLLDALSLQIGDIGSITDIEGGFQINNAGGEPLFTFYRDSTKDITIWE